MQLFFYFLKIFIGVLLIYNVEVSDVQQSEIGWNLTLVKKLPVIVPSYIFSYGY